MSEQLNLSQLAVMTSLNEMLRHHSFSICTIDRCADILGVSVRGNESYKILSALHCIDYARIPKPLREQIPNLIKDCLGVAPMELVTEPEVKQMGWVRRLLA